MIRIHRPRLRLHARLRRAWERSWALVGRVRIRWKILGIAVGSVILLGAVLTLSVRQNTRTTLRAELGSKGLSVARHFAAHNADRVLTNDLFGLHRALQVGLETDRDLTYAFIHDSEGNILAHTFSWDFPGALTALTRDMGSSRVSPIETEDGIVWDASVPLLGGQAGSVHVGLSETRLSAAVDQRTREIALLTLGVAALATIGAFGLATMLSAPILRLKGAAEEVARGDLQQEVDVGASGEIAQLATSFNAMTRELAVSRATLVRQNRELRALNTVVFSVAAATGLPETLDGALKSVRDVLGVDASWVFLTNGEKLSLARQSGLSRELELAEASESREGCVCLEVLESGRATVVRDLPLSCGRLAPEVLEESGLRCHAAVPIRSRGRILGILNVGSQDPLRFDEAEMGLLEAVTSALGAAVDNADLWEEIRERDEMRGRLIDRIFEAQEEERRRIAREIHDDTSQVLSSLIVSVDVAERALIDGDERVAAVLAQTRTECERMLERLGDLVLELRPKVLDELGLGACLEWVTQQFETRSGIDTYLEITRLGGRIAPDVETAAFRVVQEALTNVVRHAEAGRVGVVAREENGIIDVSVVDDGSGFDPARVEGMGSRHFGLLGMRERAAVAGGSFAVKSAPGRGTSIQVRLPIHGNGDEP